VIPTHRLRAPGGRVDRAGFDEAHEAMKQVRGPLDLYAHPGSAVRAAGYAGSWIAGAGHDASGCSAWDNHETLAEIVESIPLPVRALGALGRLLKAGWPRVPRPGEELRSWHLFDFFATDERRARDLVRRVMAEARARGIDFVYLIHDPGDPMLRLLRAEHSGPFCPTLGYRLLLRASRGVLPPIGRLYVDIRDL
jgi:hypothetical protein